MKVFKRIVVVLTILAFLALFCDIRMIAWLRERSEADPARKLWEPRIDFIVVFLWYSILIPWMAVSAVYLGTQFFVPLHKLNERIRKRSI
jgi:hypothetical protein